jgi:hypothetical protein
MTIGVMAGKRVKQWRISARADFSRPRPQFVPITFLFNFDAESRFSVPDFQASASFPLLASVQSLVLSGVDDL